MFTYRLQRRHAAMIGASIVSMLGMLLGTGASAHAATPAEARAAKVLAHEFATDLLNRRVVRPHGWAWRSVIQSPHLQTDRDVGAAGIGVGLLQHYRRSHDPRALAGARRAGDWLLSVADRTPHGLRWPDTADGDHENSYYSSFDDGTPGVADFLWQLGGQTHDARYTRAALAGMDWTVSQSRPAPGGGVRWRYYDQEDDYRTGIGEGNAGIVYALLTFAERTKQPRYEQAALAGAQALEAQITPQGAMPEHFVDPAGHVSPDAAYDTGFLSGGAGDAFVFLRLYQHTHDPRWLADARTLLGWVMRAQLADGSFPIEAAPTTDYDDHRATGIEEGAAGIGWVGLQAFRVTHDRTYLSMAVRAGDWLARTPPRGRRSWPEYQGASIVHTSLDNGTPGIAWFLDDLDRVRPKASYRRATTASLTWLRTVSTRTPIGGRVVYENTNRTGAHLRADPSWHWGSAGIVAYLDRMAGGRDDTPGMEPAL